MADKKEVIKYSKESFLCSDLDFNQDVLNVLLVDGEFYSIDDVNKLYDKFLLSKEVR